MFSECRKGAILGSKKTMVNLGSKTPKQPKRLQNKGKPNKTGIGLITGIALESGGGKQGKKRKKDKHFHAAACTVLYEQSGFPGHLSSYDSWQCPNPRRKLFYLQLELFYLQSWSFFAYSPLRCFLDTLSHCKQRSSIVSTRSLKCK